jgi:thiamine pyrophosphate-dependent acetolactate synthase large subunit-like protein
MKVSNLVVRYLETEGVKYVFGVPGEENEELTKKLDSDLCEMSEFPEL